MAHLGMHLTQVGAVAHCQQKLQNALQDVWRRWRRLCSVGVHLQHTAVLEALTSACWKDQSCQTS